MIFADANYFLRAIVKPVTPAQAAMASTARDLFKRVERGEEEVTSSELVLHEVIYVLSSKAHYGMDAAEIVARLKPYLLMPGFKVSPGQKRLWLRALDLFAAQPRLGFVDALIAVYVSHHGIALATFDSHFDGLPGVTRWQPRERQDLDGHPDS